MGTTETVPTSTNGARRGHRPPPDPGYGPVGARAPQPLLPQRPPPARGGAGPVRRARGGGGVEAARAAVLIPGAGGITSAYVGGENGPLPEGLRKTCPLVSVKRRGRFVYHLKPAGTAASTLKATVEDVTDEEEGAGAGAGADADAESSDDDVVLFRLDNDI